MMLLVNFVRTTAWINAGSCGMFKAGGEALLSEHEMPSQPLLPHYRLSKKPAISVEPTSSPERVGWH
jgi:hypothetical protein